MVDEEQIADQEPCELGQPKVRIGVDYESHFHPHALSLQVEDPSNCLGECPARLHDVVVLVCQVGVQGNAEHQVRMTCRCQALRESGIRESSAIQKNVERCRRE